jgi:hypothetical protein
VVEPLQEHFPQTARLLAEAGPARLRHVLLPVPAADLEQTPQEQLNERHAVGTRPNGAPEVHRRTDPGRQSSPPGAIVRLVGAMLAKDHNREMVAAPCR